MSQTQTLVVRKQLPSKATIKMDSDVQLQARWWFGGVAGAGACLFTHPLDLIKVILQTKGKTQGSVLATTLHLVKENGVLSLMNGISASLLRQLTYSTTRFAIYDLVKNQLHANGTELDAYGKIALAGCAGFLGGFVGAPADLINVRLQNDLKLLPDERRNYKHAFDGLIKVSRQEGFTKLFNGATMAMSRGAIVSIGQIAAYDQYKTLLTLQIPDMFPETSVLTHFTASLLAGTTATVITQPLDVMKTRLMANKGEYKSILHCAAGIWKESPVFGFWKGFVPAFIRLAPHTILMFVFKEQLTQLFGYYPTKMD